MTLHCFNDKQLSHRHISADRFVIVTDSAGGNGNRHRHGSHYNDIKTVIQVLIGLRPLTEPTSEPTSTPATFGPLVHGDRTTTVATSGGVHNAR